MWRVLSVLSSRNALKIKAFIRTQFDDQLAATSLNSKLLCSGQRCRHNDKVQSKSEEAVKAVQNPSGAINKIQNVQAEKAGKTLLKSF